jgi:hypothetical protein
MYLKEIDTEDMECAFELYQIPDYVLETVPEDCRGDITGAVYDVSSGELGDVYLTESNRPYDNYARYHEPSYWQPAPPAPKSIDHGTLLDELTKLASAQVEGSVTKQVLLQTIECIDGVPYAVLALAMEENSYCRVSAIARAAGVLKDFAKSYLSYYSPDLTVQELYDCDRNFAEALADLTNPGFEYPDWSYKTIGQVLKIAEAVAELKKEH